MANHKSAEKRARQNIKRRARNKSKKSAVRTAIKGLKVAIEEKNLDSAKTALLKTQSMLSKLAKSSAIKAKTASRITSRLTASVNKISK